MSEKRPKQFTLREMLVLGFCASFIVILRVVFRLHLHITGHAMFFTLFFLVMSKGAVPKPWSATVVGFLAGVMLMFLGMGKGGPLVIFKLLLPGVVVDLCGLFIPGVGLSYVATIATGAMAAASRFLSLMIVDRLVGMEWQIILQHAAVASFFNVLFGCLGAAMVPPVLRRLKSAGLVS